ncbi:carbohydrate ABC transporter permease [Alicyclobacillus fastidiosus]|uniref:Carbohydrate ABC transporter permease n=2 Tax=Alicyclobacillus fastidiosus TaxID=392011 RepID=A0ABY6ZAZ0_9BACL|nr:carbohydrate ABC transporter permease [Alicyclobacillus fastidiosus]WAH39999.1 carbohydrate ABC transporter permease [Alicyclobacillus fastidiosus]GMA61291.1 ABC transporter permease [Alicyclobacillus fastidiosus]
MQRNMTGGRRVFTIVNVLFLVLISSTMIVPLWNALAESFSSNLGSMQPGILMWPRHFSLSGYQTVWTVLDLWKPFENSVLVSVLGTLLHVVLSTLAGYALAQPSLPGRRAITGLILITMMIPFEAIMIPFYVTIQQLGLLNTLVALILSGAVSGFSIILMKNFFQSIPSDILDAAKIDGAGHFRCLWRIYLPLSKAGLATVTLFEFVTRWNNLLTTVLLINDSSKDTLQVALNGLVNEGSATSSGNLVTTNVKMAGIIIAVLPLMLAYPFVQKYFVKGIFLGASKE